MLDLTAYGFAPGGYYHPTCHSCKDSFTGAKQAWNCRGCALRIKKEAEAIMPEILPRPVTKRQYEERARMILEKHGAKRPYELARKITEELYGLGGSDE